MATVAQGSKYGKVSGPLDSVTRIMLHRPRAHGLYRVTETPSRHEMAFSGVHFAFRRIDRGLSRAAVAKRMTGWGLCHISAGVVRSWEDVCSGTDDTLRVPNANEFLALCRVLRCEPADLCDSPRRNTRLIAARIFGPGGWLAWKNGTGPGPATLLNLPEKLRQESRRGVLSKRAAKFLAKLRAHEAAEIRKHDAKYLREFGAKALRQLQKRRERSDRKRAEFEG